MAPRLVVRASHAFDGERALPGGASVLVEDGRIVGVEPAEAPLPDGWPVADFPDATILPGLIDAHVHLCGDAGPGALERLPAFDDEHLAGVTAQVHVRIDQTGQDRGIREVGHRPAVG